MFACERELETEQNCNILTPLLWPSALCLSLSPDAQPEAQGLTLLTFSATSHQQRLWTPTYQGPFGLAWLSLLQLVSNSNLSPTDTPTLTSVWTELYNSSTSTQSPTRFLEWHVWSSSSGNNCHAVHRSLSSGASLWSGTFTLSHIISRDHLRGFLS